MTLEERLDRAEARAAIGETIHAYARAVRRGRADEAAALFAGDGVFHIGEGPPDASAFTERARLEGRAQIEAYVGKAKGPLPMIHNLIVRIDGETAEAESVMEAPVFGTDKRVMGEYRDRLVRIDGHWRFAERRYTIFSGA